MIKLKIIKSLLEFNIKIGRKLTFWLAKYEADEYAIKNEKFDFRTIPSRIKHSILYDQDIINKRFDECKECDYLVKTTSQCRKCGCFMKVKTRLAMAKCPIGKWDKEYIGDSNVISPAT